MQKLKLIKILFILLFLFQLSNETKAQYLSVYSVNGAKRMDGTKIKEKDSLSTHDTIRIKGKGSVTLRYKTGWEFSLYKGFYSIDSCFKANKLSNYRSDSIYSIMEARNLFHCERSNYDGCFHCFGSSRSRKEFDLSLDYIAFENQERNFAYHIETNNDSIILNWVHPNNYNGLYFISIQSIFEDPPSFEISDTNSIKLAIKKNKESFIIVKILSEDCKQSRALQLLKIKTP